MKNKLFEDPRLVAVDPLPQFLLEAIWVIIMTRLLGEIFKYFKQPAVIGQVFGGIFLGPSVLGQINWWGKTFFFPSSLGAFTMVSNVGLIFFMFLVGLELDIDVMKKNVRFVPVARCRI